MKTSFDLLPLTIHWQRLYWPKPMVEKLIPCLTLDSLYWANIMAKSFIFVFLLVKSFKQNSHFSFLSLTEETVGKHDDAIRCVEFCSDVNVLVTGSWDQTVKLWDARISHCAGSFSQPDKVNSNSYFYKPLSKVGTLPWNTPQRVKSVSYTSSKAD